MSAMASRIRSALAFARKLATGEQHGEVTDAAELMLDQYILERLALRKNLIQNFPQR